MSKFSYTFPAILIIILAVGIASWSFLKVSGNPLNSINSVNKNVTATELPISLPNKAVESVIVTYIITGTIIELRKTPEGREIIMNLNTQNLPRFIIAPGRTAFWNASIEPVIKLANGASLTKGQLVKIEIKYFPSRKSWDTLSAVVILPNK